MDKTVIGAEEIYLAPENENDTDINLKDKSNEDVNLESDVKSKKIIQNGEIYELRDSNRKVYRMSDGTEQAVFYPETVHVYNNDTNTFDDVDNTIIEEDNGKHFVSGRNHFVAKFSKEEENDELFSIESGIHRVIVSAKKNKKLRNKGMKPYVRKKDVSGNIKSDMLVFENVEYGSDFEYSVSGNGIKENIVVKEKAEVYRYSFVLHMENVTAKFDETKKRVAFVNVENGEEVFFIPAPFMSDANGAISTAVSYELKNTNNGDAFFTITVDNEWVNDEKRAWPIIIDPQIQVSGNFAMSTYSWNDGNMYNSLTHTIGTTNKGDGIHAAKRMYISFNIPELPCNPRIKKAELKLFQSSGSCMSEEYPKIGIYQVTDEISTGTCSPSNARGLIDYAKIKVGHCEDGEVISYTFDVTTLVDQVNKGEVGVKNLVLKMIDETSEDDNSIVIYSSNYSGNIAPQFIITYESTYGVNSSYRTHTHELGRFGQGSIDLQCGNLMFESEDFAWSGNRMPVTIKHLYNSSLAEYQYTKNDSIKLNVADFSAMNIGLGWKLNIMQSMVASTFQHDGVSYLGYVYTGENGEENYFKKSNEQVCCDSGSQCYNLYEDVNNGDLLYDPFKLILKQGEETYQFDSMGRLVQIKDESGNHMDITYTSNRITSVTDGAGRDFTFAYNSDNQLISITAPDNTSIRYAYINGFLGSITYEDDKKVIISYSNNKPSRVVLFDTNGDNVYRVSYSYSGNRLESVKEYGVENDVYVGGVETFYTYSAASGRTLVETIELKDETEGESEDTIIETVYTFDDEGNIVSEYVYSEDTGNTGVKGEGSGIHPYSGDSGAGIVSNINNLLTDHNFEDPNAWISMPENSDDFRIGNYPYQIYAKYGEKLLRMQSYQEDCNKNGVYQVTDSLPAGQYTFSVYVRVLSTFSGTDAGTFIRVTDTSGNVLGVSECLSESDNEYTRLIVPFELADAQSVNVQILVNGKGAVYVDAAQLENNPYANTYNMLENGNFERSSGWSISSETSYTNGVCFNMSRSLMMTGDLESSRYAYQDVAVKKTRSTRETFTLSGWAKGYSLPNHERDGVTTPPTFRLRAVVKYNDTYYGEIGEEEFTADFSPCTEDWQFASIQFSKSKYRTIEYIRVYCDYGYNTGTVYFDDIQFVRNSIETGLSASDFVVESTGEAEDEAEETTDTTPTFSEAMDSFGNALTETTFTDGEFGTIYRAFGFTPDLNNAENTGNDLVSETDSRGNKVLYTVDEDTSRNEEVTDRCGNKTAYEYDSTGKTTKVTSKDAAGAELANVSYAYDAFDNMTEIIRGDGMKYALSYNAYHNLESIGVDGKDEKLVQYTYKTGNGRLKEIAYANGDKMKATYNGVGQMVAEKWFDKDNALTAHYKYVYDGQGNIVRSIDILGQKEYNYEYEEGNLLRATESNIVLSEEIVISKSLVNTVKYYYDADDKMTKKVITSASGSAQTIYYENSEDNTVVKFNAGGKTITAHSKTDSFGRKVFDELQLGTGFVSRQFHYHAGEVTEEHKDNAKLKSSATTQLVSQIVLSGGRTISYEYDEEERITKVDDSVDGITTYTYDALGQLLTETVNGTVVNTMTYDNYGNVRTKNGIEYTYGDENWKDLLTGYGDQTITYDKQGNPTNYLGHTLTWEKGRQLKKFVKADETEIEYTYNANGIRTSKKVDGVLHTYTLDGTKILREIWGNNTLIPLYDNEDGVCGILYNNVPYYFIKNLQGDVIAIVDKEAKTVARYSYDAWGVCTLTQDSVGIATINPFRYRSYYYDEEIQLYYLQSRYYNPIVGRFINADENTNIGIGESLCSFNLYAYTENNPVNMIDEAGYAAINVICAAIGAIAGWFFGDWVAKKLGYRSGWKYWAIRVGVVVGGAVIGWFAGTLIAKLIATYLKSNPAIILKLGNKLGPKVFKNSMEFLGINPFALAMDSSKFVAIARVFNTKVVTLPYGWVTKLYDLVRKFGYKIVLDSPHGGYSWHIHLSGGNGRLKNLHIQIVKSAWDWLKRRIG